MKSPHCRKSSIHSCTVQHASHLTKSLIATKTLENSDAKASIDVTGAELKGMEYIRDTNKENIRSKLIHTSKSGIIHYSTNSALPTPDHHLTPPTAAAT